MNPTSNFTSFLPSEIFVHIFSYLSIETLAITANVSKQYNSISNSDEIWKPICRTVFPELFKVKSAIKDDSSFKGHFKNHVFSIISLVLENSEVAIHGFRWGVRIFSKEFLACLDSKKPSWKQVKAIRAYVNTPIYDGGSLQSRLWTACSEAYPDQGHGSQNLRILKIMLMCGADPNYSHDTYYCRTALFSAAFRAVKESVQLLLEYGADPTITNSDNQTAYDLVGEFPCSGATEADKVGIRTLLKTSQK